MLVVDNKAQRESLAEEIKVQVQNGKLAVFEQGILLNLTLALLYFSLHNMFLGHLFHSTLLSYSVSLISLPSTRIVPLLS